MQLEQRSPTPRPNGLRSDRSLQNVSPVEIPASQGEVPSPPRSSCPTRDELFAIRGPPARWRPVGRFGLDEPFGDCDRAGSKKEKRGRHCVLPPHSIELK